MQATLLILPRKIQGFFKIRPVRSGDRDFPSGVGGAARVVRRAEGFKLPMRFRRPGPLMGITRRSSARAHVTVFLKVACRRGVAPILIGTKRQPPAWAYHTYAVRAG